MKNVKLTMIACLLSLTTGSIALAQNIPTDGLVGYWEGNGTAVDSFGSHNGTLSGGASYAAGQYGQGFEFNGSNEVVTVLHDVGLQPASITVAAWVQTTTPSGLTMIVEKSHGPGNLGWALQMQNGVVAWASGNGSGFPQLNGSTLINDGSFHHVAVTIDDAADVMRVFVDGVEDAVPLAYTSPQAGNSENVNIGAWWNNVDNGSYAREFNGVIDDVAIYNRALSQSEIGQLMAQSVPEPGSFLFCLGGLVAVSMRRRR